MTLRPDVIVQITDLTKNYGQLAAVQDVSFSIRRGEVLGLIGPNGSGKTTVFECLGGVLPFESGSIEPRVAGGKPVMFYLPDAITPWPEPS
jgi:ABC-type branched-subunit amino acid transport system ATPase component